MKPLLASDISGVWATVLLRIGEDGKIDHTGIDEQIEAFAQAGVDGIYSNGTATEFHCQSDEDFRDLSKQVARLCQDHNLPFQLGASHPLPVPTLERIGYARSLSPGAIQVTLPDWVPIDLGTAQRFLTRCVDEAGGNGLVLYNPPHAKTVLAPADYRELVTSVPELVGIKCAGGDGQWYRAMAPVLERLSVFVPGHHMASGRAQGAHGSYSNMACLNPSATVAWNRMITADPEKALALEARIARFMDQAIAPILEAGFPGYACDKLMASIGDWATITPRLLWPHAGVPDHFSGSVRAHAEDLLPEFIGPSALGSGEALSAKD